HLPCEYQMLVNMIDTLPRASPSPFSPMVSLVLNINVRTEAHRDGFDKELCLVMPVGKFSSGELVLVEQGLVFPLRNGDVAVFCSAESTHFNMSYTGRHCSFVMQTDMEFKKWTNGYNRWLGSKYFK
ncbi:hypothetical protein SCLCIDRAFT_109853, partial [Scleroderma citrinum Foug A]